MTNKYLLWFKNRWLWLGSLLVSLLITTGWLYESLSPEADHLVGPVGIENALVKRLDIAIQYPASLSADDRGSNAKHLIVTTYADAAPTPNSVLINLKAPIGVINFLDKDGNRITGLINLPITRGDMPTSVRLEHANTSLAASLQEVPIETSILRSAGQDDIGTRVPELRFTD